jgi:lipoprotein Spr
MRNNYLWLLLFFLIVNTSCKSIKNIASRDTSSGYTVKKSAQNNGSVNFIEHIEVTPGTVVTSKHKSIETASSKKTKAVSTASNNESAATTTISNNNNKESNIENADYLQLKYAMMLDATVEKLTNIPLLQVIERWWGTKYCLGGSTDRCIDCSAFTQTVVKDVYDISLPRTSGEQYNFSDEISTADLKEGDLVFFHTGGKRKRISHVGLYLMNNKFVHASTSNGVMISDLNDNYWRQHYKGAGRILRNNSSAKL